MPRTETSTLRAGLLLGALLLGPGPGRPPSALGAPPAAAPAARAREITLYALAEVHGTPEPCGCTSTPLGDVARVHDEHAVVVHCTGVRGGGR